MRKSTIIYYVLGDELTEYIDCDKYPELVAELGRHEIAIDMTFTLISEAIPAVMYLLNGDPGYPAEGAEYEVEIDDILYPRWAAVMLSVWKPKDSNLFGEQKAFTKALETWFDANKGAIADKQYEELESEFF